MLFIFVRESNVLYDEFKIFKFITSRKMIKTQKVFVKCFFSVKFSKKCKK